MTRYITNIFLFEQAGLRVWDVEILNTHGGSLRVYGCRQGASYEKSDRVAEIIERETRFGLLALSTYQSFQARADRVKNDLLVFLIEQKMAGNTVVAYGAAAKGNTLLNYAGVKPDLLSYVCDAAPSKQNKFMPGSHIPILPPDFLRKKKPDIVLILPWNIASEVMDQLAYIKEWGGKFAVAVPQIKVFE